MYHNHWRIQGAEGTFRPPPQKNICLIKKGGRKKEREKERNEREREGGEGGV